MPVMVICEPHPLPENIQEVVKKWEKEEKSRLFALILDGAHPHLLNFSRFLVRKIREEQSQIKDIETIDVILDSRGGDIDASYQLINFLRADCKKLRVFVPNLAKSAATFFCLGADEIWMSNTSELGPLDAQIPDPRSGDETISALEEFKAIEYLKDHAFKILDLYVRLLIRSTSMRLHEIIKEATAFVTQLVKPLYSQVDPLYFGASHRALDVAVEYGKRVMPQYAYKNWSKNRIDDLLEKLTWSYPSHSFVIDYPEAKRLGLNVHLLEGQRNEDAQLIESILESAVGLMNIEVEEPKPKEEERTTNETKTK